MKNVSIAEGSVSRLIYSADDEFGDAQVTEDDPFVAAGIGRNFDWSDFLIAGDIPLPSLHDANAAEQGGDSAPYFLLISHRFYPDKDVQFDQMDVDDVNLFSDAMSGAKRRKFVSRRLYTLYRCFERPTKDGAPRFHPVSVSQASLSSSQSCSCRFSTASYWGSCTSRIPCCG